MDLNSVSLVPALNINSNNLYQWTKLFGAVAIFRGGLLASAVVYSVSLAAASFSILYIDTTVPIHTGT